MMNHPSSSMSNRSKDFDMAELDQDVFEYLDGHDQSSFQDNRQTLNIFPSQPMHAVDPYTQVGEALANGSTSKNPINQSMEVSPTLSKSGDHAPPALANQAKDRRPIVKREGSGKATTSSSEQEAPKTPDAKTLRRLAQNREAARKSRLRKKAYIQQLETSRIRLSQLEQDLQMARAQGMMLSGGGLMHDQGLPTASGALTSEAAMFDMEYARWLEEHHKLMCQLRAALEEHLPENQLQLLVESTLSHHEILINIKGAIAKSDVFHLTTGTWMSPAERCFLWIGGYRPGELIKIVLRHIEPLTEQQIVAIYNLQQSVQESEDVLNHGLDAVHRSLSDTITSDVLTSSTADMVNFMGRMSVAMSKLTSLEAFVRQADSLRLQTLHRLQQILTVNQAAQCFLAITEYFHRLRTLSSLWVTRPRQDGL